MIKGVKLTAIDGGESDHVFDFGGHHVATRIHGPASKQQKTYPDALAESRPRVGRKPLWLTESGLYSLIITSQKQEAKRFKKWVTAEVLPEIRKRGYYSLVEVELQKQKERLLAEHFPGLPGPSQRLAASLIERLLRKFGWAPASGAKVEAKRGNPPRLPRPGGGAREMILDQNLESMAESLDSSPVLRERILATVKRIRDHKWFERPEPTGELADSARALAGRITRHSCAPSRTGRWTFSGTSRPC